MKLGDIAKESKETFKGDKAGIPIVGLEHLIPQELTFSNFDVDSDNTFTKVFHKGQILFGRRRAYLKKAAVAEFDGVCSGDITVIEAIPSKVDKNLLPFIIQNDALFDYAVSRSAGGLSPRVKWEQLADYEIDLPSLEKQKILADKLWAAYRLKQAYKKLLAATDEMVKSQFIEMFNQDKKVSINEMVDTVWGTSPSSETYNEERIGMPFYQGKAEFGDVYINDAIVYCSRPIKIANKNEILMSVRAPVGAVNIAKEQCCIGRGLAAITPKIGIAEKLFIFHALRIIEDDIDRLSTGSTFKAINKDGYNKITLPMAMIDKQRRFVAIAEQADKSKFELRKSIDAIDKVIKSLINNVK